MRAATAARCGNKHTITLLALRNTERKTSPLWVGLSRINGVSNMNKTMPLGITVIYFNDQSKNIYAELPPDKEQAKRLSKRIYKDAMTALASREQLSHR